jgi:hypothetical protein
MVMKKRRPIPQRIYRRDVPELVVISNSKMSLNVERAPSSKEITRHDWKWSKLLFTIKLRFLTEKSSSLLSLPMEKKI